MSQPLLYTACMHIALAPAGLYGCNLLLAYFSKDYITTVKANSLTCVFLSASMLQTAKELAPCVANEWWPQICICVRLFVSCPLELATTEQRVGNNCTGHLVKSKACCIYTIYTFMRGILSCYPQCGVSSQAVHVADHTMHVIAGVIS